MANINFPLLNASLNFAATVLLVVGFLLIRQRREVAHVRVMITAFAVSTAFLVSYVAYHVWPIGAASTPFRGQGAARVVYFGILISHIVLAMAVPPLALLTIWLGWTDRREKHRKTARWTLPIWLYVSVTGVIIYVMLYHLFPQPTAVDAL